MLSKINLMYFYILSLTFICLLNFIYTKAECKFKNIIPNIDCRDMTEKLLKATLNPNTHTHTPNIETFQIKLKNRKTLSRRLLSK